LEEEEEEEEVVVVVKEEEEEEVITDGHSESVSSDIQQWLILTGAIGE
jgi:hypothetical protein